MASCVETCAGISSKREKQELIAKSGENNDRERNSWHSEKSGASWSRTLEGRSSSIDCSVGSKGVRTCLLSMAGRCGELGRVLGRAVIASV